MKGRPSTRRYGMLLKLNAAEHDALELLRARECLAKCQVKNPALPGGAFVNQEGMCLRFATGCHSSPLFRAGHPGRSS